MRVIPVTHISMTLLSLNWYRLQKHLFYLYLYLLFLLLFLLLLFKHRQVIYRCFYKTLNERTLRLLFGYIIVFFTRVDEFGFSHGHFTCKFLGLLTESALLAVAFLGLLGDESFGSFIDRSTTVFFLLRWHFLLYGVQFH